MFLIAFLSEAAYLFFVSESKAGSGEWSSAPAGCWATSKFALLLLLRALRARRARFTGISAASRNAGIACARCARLLRKPAWKRPPQLLTRKSP